MTNQKYHEVQSWHRRPDEGLVPYQHFRSYLDMPPPRTYAAYAEKSGLKEGSIQVMASQHDWKAREAAWMAASTPDLDQRLIEARAALKVKAIAEAVSDGARLRDLWRNTMARIEKKMVNEDDFSLTPNELKQMVQARDQIDQFNRRQAGLPHVYKAIEEDADEKEDTIFLLDDEKGPIRVLGEGEVATSEGDVAPAAREPA